MHAFPRTVADYESHEAHAQRLRDELAEVVAESQRITEQGVDLYAAIDRLVRAFADKHRCDASSIMDNIDRDITGLVDDASGPAQRRLYRLENELSLAEGES